MVVRQPVNDIFVGIGARLLEERSRLRMTQPEFGSLAGASGQTQMRYEKGEQTPKLEYLSALVPHGVDAGYIVTGQRSDGSIHPLEKSFLNDFRRLHDRNKEDLMFLTAAMLKAQGKDVGEEAQIVGRIVASLVDYQTMSVTEWVADLKKGRQSQSQAVHSPSLDYRPKPKDD